MVLALNRYWPLSGPLVIRTIFSGVPGILGPPLHILNALNLKDKSERLDFPTLFPTLFPIRFFRPNGPTGTSRSLGKKRVEKRLIRGGRGEADAQ